MDVPDRQNGLFVRPLVRLLDGVCHYVTADDEEECLRCLQSVKHTVVFDGHL